MRKKLLLILIATPLMAQAYTSWEGEKMIRNNTSGLCLKAPKYRYAHTDPENYASYATCDSTDRFQIWTYTNGRLRFQDSGGMLTGYKNTNSLLNQSDTPDGFNINNGVISLQSNEARVIKNRSSWDPVWKVTVSASLVNLGGDYSYATHTFMSSDTYVPTGGNVVPGFDSSKHRVMGVTAKMNGGSIGGNYTANLVDRSDLGAGRWDAHIQTGIHNKVVELKFEGKKVTAIAAKYRVGGYQTTGGYIPALVATNEVEQGYGVHSLQASFAADIRKLLPTEADLGSKLNTLDFIKTVFLSGSKEAVLELTDGYWLYSVNLPENTSEIPTGSTLRVSSNAGYNAWFKDKFILTRGVTYVMTYNGKTWDIARNLGASYVNTAGLVLPESSSITSLNVSAQMNGASVVGDYNTTSDYLGEGRYNLYIVTPEHTKVVEVQVAGGVVKALGAKYRTGSYDRFASDYIPASLATSPTTGGYGVHDVVVTFGTYQPKTRNMRDYAADQAELTTKLGSLNFYKTIWGTRPDVLEINVENYYWIGNITLPSNTNTIATGSVAKIKATSDWNTAVNGATLTYGVAYTFTYNGTSWTRSQ